MEEIFKLAGKKGFKPDVQIYPTFIEADTGIIDYKKLDRFLDIKQYLWLCELQKWLMKKHGLYAYIDYENLDGVIIDYKCIGVDVLFREPISLLNEDALRYSDYLEPLLIEALKLLK